MLLFAEQETPVAPFGDRFDVLEIIPAAIGNHQDLVVLRKKAGSVD